MIEWLQDEECGIALDTRHHPVLISTWYGASSVDVIDRYFSWSDATAAAALAAEQQLLHIADLTRAHWPSAAVRKRVFEHSSVNLSCEVMLATIVVCGDLTDRLTGMARSVDKLNVGRHEAPLFIVETVAEGIAIALEQMWSARIPPPLGLEPGGYQTPRLDLSC
ncbi:hypothetical protein DB30_05140 [Enhygromyxa salina]|uniref:Uncharacterized protein n=1 Tax=Enhygromyxa salina TaxID=215803 RepID=A0A0C1ZE52_9BACT|nr:hypothetical protein [Enhygromyxa salina]KIG15949.1 hypothetical protein DB30_05140 [Enhygromyxa salina]